MKDFRNCVKVLNEMAEDLEKKDIGTYYASVRHDGIEMIIFCHQACQVDNIHTLSVMSRQSPSFFKN